MWKRLGVFILAFCAAAMPALAQRNESPYGDDSPAASQPAPTQQNQRQNSDNAPAAQAPENQPQAARPRRARDLPATLTLPAGTSITARMNQYLSSDRNHAGDTFTAVLDQPIVAHGWVVARRGQTVLGRVDVAQKAADGNGVSKLRLEMTELTLVDGEQVSISTEMQQAPRASNAQRSPGQDVATVSTTTVLGTILGAAIGGGQGAAIGAGLGATAGVATVLYTRGRPTTLGLEALLSFRLAAPLEISTERGAVAFQPVTQGDYKDQDAYANAPRRRAGPAYPRPYYYGGCGPWGWDCAPGPYWGPYIAAGVWGYGPRYGRRGRFR